MRTFRRLAVVTTALTYALIAVGGLVRASGAGLGCPDWPRCFGSWIPPASAAELPPQFDASQFNVELMWTEYLNRLLGVSVGFAILATAIAAWGYRRRAPGITWASVAALLLTGYEGWLGGRVVAHELAPWIVTAHMLVALVIVLLLLWATVESFVVEQGTVPAAAALPLGRGALAVIALLLVEIAIGTQVRGRVDVALELVTRNAALDAVGPIEVVHRAAAGLVLIGVSGLWLLALARYRQHRAVVWAAHGVLLCTLLQISAGAILKTRALPPPAQVLHLTTASLLLGALMLLALTALRWPRLGAAR